MTKMTRILRTLAALAVIATLAPALVGCGPKKPVLHIYTWSDYKADGVVERFEEAHNCKVVIDTYDSNEAMYAKLTAGATGYDLLFPSSYMVKLLYKNKMIQPIDHSKIPNLSQLDPAYLALAFDKEMDHSVPYTVTIGGLGYLGSRVDNPVASWSMLDRTEFKGRMTLLDDYRETIGAALKANGFSVNTTDDAELAAAKETVLRWKKNIAKFDNEQYKNGLASGEFFITHGYSGDVKLVKDENDDVQFLVPAEGATLSIDDMVIPVGAKEVDLAHAFINAILEPVNAAELVQEIYYLCPNLGGYELLPEDFRNDPIFFPPSDVISKLEMLDDLGEANVKYTRIWDEIKAAE